MSLNKPLPSSPLSDPVYITSLIVVIRYALASNLILDTFLAADVPLFQSYCVINEEARWMLHKVDPYLAPCIGISLGMMFKTREEASGC